MHVTAIGIGFIDAKPGAEEEFNRWYDLDHLPENVAIEGITGGRRYVATPDCKAARGAQPIEALSDGKGTFCTTYLFSGADIAPARAEMTSLAKRLAEDGRMYRRARTAYFSTFRLARTFVRKGLPMAPEAAPWFGHTGIIVWMGDCADAVEHARRLNWYDDVHLPDLLEAQGILAGFRLEGMTPAEQYRIVNLLFVDGDPTASMRDIMSRVPKWKAAGHLLESRPGVFKEQFRSPFRFISPLQYPFLKA
ncbi:MAG: hypothetical protein HY261_05935 [Chloroflexi bacterium]|nr:hypothetical protein [Chloroflexota bacterium]